MNKTRFAGLLLAFLLGPIGLWLGATAALELAVRLSAPRLEGAAAPWTSLGHPPGEVVGIVTADSERVRVQVAGGAQYEASRACGSASPECWAETGPEGANVQTEIGPACRSRFEGLGDPPGRLVQCASHVELGADVHWEAHYALVESGEVWVWQHAVGALGFSMLDFFPWPCVGGLAGLFAGVSLALGLARVLSR